MWLAHDHEGRISNYYLYIWCPVLLWQLMFYELYQQESWLVQDSCWDNLYPVSKIWNLPLLTKPLHHCHWTASYWPHPVCQDEGEGPHKKESERKGNLEYILRGWVYKKRWHMQTEERQYRGRDEREKERHYLRSLKHRNPSFLEVWSHSYYLSQNLAYIHCSFTSHPNMHREKDTSFYWLEVCTSDTHVLVYIQKNHYSSSTPLSPTTPPSTPSTYRMTECNWEWM